MPFNMQLYGLLTLVLAAGATSAALVGWYMLSDTKIGVGRKMRNYLVVHAALLFITMLFGVAGFTQAPQWIWHFIYSTRVAVLFLELIFLVTLVKEFYDIYNKPE